MLHSSGSFSIHRYRNWNQFFSVTVGMPTVFVVALCALGIGMVLGVFFGKRILSQRMPITVSKVPEINRLLETVREHVVINTTEDPTVATVENPETLRQQNPLFYKDVQTGDKLIVWSDRAVLYSPKRDVVLAALVAPDILGATGGNAAVAEQSLSVEIRNGSGKPGATTWLVDRLSESGYNVSATQKTEKIYDATLVIRGSEKSRNNPLETFLSLSGGSLAELPAGEEPATTDILVILGKDQS